MYKVKTFREITKLERNDLFVYESVPGTAVEPVSYTHLDVYKRQGVKACLAKMNGELAEMMNYTGCGSLDKMDATVLRFKDGRIVV